MEDALTTGLTGSINGGALAKQAWGIRGIAARIKLELRIAEENPSLIRMHPISDASIWVLQ